MKEVTLKVYGNLVILESYSFPVDRTIEVSCLHDDMESFQNKIELDELILDKDMELKGDVYVKNLIIPDGVRFRILCAKGLTSLI